MKKHLTLPARLEVIHYPTQTVVKLWLSTDAIRDWCLGLSLMKEGLTDGLVISPAAGKGNVELRVDASLSPQDRIRGSLGKAGAVHFGLTTNVLDFLLVFGLKCYRDGWAEVDHVDLEAQIEGIHDLQNAYFTVHFQEFAPPVSAEEAKRRLGD